MGGGWSDNELLSKGRPDRKVFVNWSGDYEIYQSSYCFSKSIKFVFELSYERYKWTVRRTMSETRNLLYRLRYSASLMKVLKADDKFRLNKKRLDVRRGWCSSATDAKILKLQGEAICSALQDIVDNDDMFQHHALRDYLYLSVHSFNPTRGPSLEMWLRKSSGGYHEGYSNSWGDYMSITRTRWFVFYKNQILWYNGEKHNIKKSAKGVFHINAGFKLGIINSKRLTVMYLDNGSRVLRISCGSRLETLQLFETLKGWYHGVAECVEQPNFAPYPVRSLSDVKVCT